MWTALTLSVFVPAAAPTANLPVAPPEPFVSPFTIAAQDAVYDATDLPEWYFGIGIQSVTTTNSNGPGSEEIDFNEGIAIPLVLGRRLVDQDDGPFGFSAELEAIYTNQEADRGAFGLTGANFQADLTGFNVMLNGIFDTQVTDWCTLYGGGGVGIGWLDVGNENDGAASFSDEDGPFLAWQVKAGALFRASEYVSIDLGYRFLNVDDVQFDDTNGVDPGFGLETEQHMIGLGLRFTR